MRKTILFAAAMLALSAVSSFAGDLKYGLGYFRPEAPVGGRVWLNDKTALDAGLGFSYDKVDGAADASTGYVFDAGLPFVLASSGSAKFFLRPGFTYASASPAVGNDASQFWVSGSFGVEYFMTDNFSVQAAHGLVYKSVDNGTVKSTSIESEDFGLSSIGFHFYFGGK
jgi:hypothetical protein